MCPRKPWPEAKIIMWHHLEQNLLTLVSDPLFFFMWKQTSFRKRFYKSKVWRLLQINTNPFYAAHKGADLKVFTTVQTICDGLVVTCLQALNNLRMVDSQNALEPCNSFGSNPADGCSGRMKLRFMKLLAYYMDAQGRKIYFPLLTHPIFLVFIHRGEETVHRWKPGWAMSPFFLLGVWDFL